MSWHSQTNQPSVLGQHEERSLTLERWWTAMVRQKCWPSLTVTLFPICAPSIPLEQVEAQTKHSHRKALTVTLCRACRVENHACLVARALIR
eukprot:2484344-Amphidinium_carterae.1